ncbi:MAG: hypothetical protein ACRDOK_21650 [Streptosporangiaceae bacterium]
MTENVSSDSLGSLFFKTARQAPSSKPLTAVSGIDPLAGPAGMTLHAAALRDEALQQEIMLMLACLQRRAPAEVAAGPLHSDGTLGLDSMTAVWVIATIGRAFGCKLLKLSEVDRDSLRSVGGLASLVRQSIAELPLLAGAA